MRLVCDSCNAKYMISDDKVGAKGVKIKCKKCGHMILARPAGAAASKDNGASDAPAVDTEAPASASNGAAGAAAAGLPSSVGSPPSEGLFSGVEEDEIGAVFDQVLSSGPHKISVGDPLGDAPRDSKPSAASAIQKLAEAESKPDEPKEEAAPASDWYVAIEDRQVGPLTVEKIKEHWDRGEVGPDSLCWRAGFGDWIPLSEATELASVLAPRPAKPVIVTPAAMAPAAPAAPVESAFSAGAAAKSARAEIPAAPALGAEPTSSGWKPSAASVLASLVKEENEALSKPAPKPSPVEERPAMGGLLDLPPEPVAAPAARAAPVLAAMAAEPAMHAPQPAPMPYAPVAPAPVYAQPAPAYPQPAYAAGYPQPAYPGYPPPGVGVPQGGNNKTVMMIGIAAVGVLLLGTVLFLALKGSSNSNGISDSPQRVATTQPVAPAPKPVEPPATATPTNTVPPPAPNPQGTATPPPAAVAAAAGTQPEANPGTPPAVAAATPPAVTPPTPSPAAVEPKPAEPRTEQPPRVAERDPVRTTPKPRVNNDSVATVKPSPKPPPTDELDDDFDSLFGKPKAQPKPASNPGPSPTPYIPPEPGGGGKVQESLAQSDIMAVVLNNKPAIVKCVNEQKKRDPGISGKLVMRWVIQTSGRTSSVSVRTEEFKKTYMASCITGLIKQWNFPKHKKQGEPIDFPFTF
jgi:predicted Zn finger-like uncharacterized protein